MVQDEPSDEFLIEAIAGGAMWALERLYDRYGRRCYALTYRMIADKMVTEELVQDTFLAVWQSAASYVTLAGPVRSWLFSINYHRTINYLRGERRRSTLQRVSLQEIEEHEQFALPDVCEQACNSIENAELYTCLLQLSTEQRAVIELAYFEGWTQGEIAQQYQIPLGTVKARIRLGISHLRRILLREGVENSLSCNSPSGEARPRKVPTVLIEAMENGCTAGYELCRDGSCRCFGYTEWEHLVGQIEAFEFRGATGCFIARKEKRAHDCTYWYAYTWGKVGRRKTYLGRPAELTLARLEAMARQLYEIERGD